MSYLIFIIGIFLAHIILLGFWLAFASLICSATVWIYTNNRILKLICIAVWAISYGNLRIIYRLNSLVTQTVQSFTLNGYLSAPSLPTHNHFRQAELTISSGALTAKTLLLTYPESNILLAGHNYNLTVNLQPFHFNINPTAFNYNEYLINNNISGLAFLRQINYDNGISISPLAIITAVRTTMIDYMQQAIGAYQYAGLAIALVTGYQALITTQQWQIFKNTGIVHIVSISGLHITLLAGLAIALTNLLLQLIRYSSVRLSSKIITLWIGMSVALLYSLLAGFSVPTQRTFYLLLVNAYLFTIRYHISVLHKLAICACVVLAIDPFACISPGFCLSFGIVACILVVSDWYQAKFSKIRFWYVLTLAINIVSLPLGLYFFKYHALIGIIANIWAIPVIGSIMTPALLVASLLHNTWTLHLILQCFNIVMLPISYLGTISAPYWQATPNLATLAISYSGIILLFIPSFMRYQRSIACSMMLALLLVSIPRHYLRLVAFSTNGTGIVLVQTRTHQLLYIAADAQESTIILNLTHAVLPYLQQQHIDQIDYLIAPFYMQIIASLRQNHINTLTYNHLPDIIDDINFQLLSQQLIIRNIEQLSFIGSVCPHNIENKWQNIIYFYRLQQDISCLMYLPIKNLAIDYSSTQALAAATILDNLNLSSQHVYNLQHTGGVILQ